MGFSNIAVRNNGQLQTKETGSFNLDQLREQHNYYSLAIDIHTDLAMRAITYGGAISHAADLYSKQCPAGERGFRYLEDMYYGGAGNILQKSGARIR